MSTLNDFATASIRARGPTRIGAIKPSLVASRMPSSELWSQGCTTAVGMGGSVLQASIRRSYFSCFALMVMPSCVPGRIVVDELVAGERGTVRCPTCHCEKEAARPP